MRKHPKLGLRVLKTHDGVEIFEDSFLPHTSGDLYYVDTNKDIWDVEICNSNSPVAKNREKYPNDIIFAKEENADEYILMNEPCLSVNEIYKAIEHGDEEHRKWLLDKLKELKKQNH
jgi:hypothetical protein